MQIDEKSDFPSILEIINIEGKFKADYNKIDQGYPILKW